MLQKPIKFRAHLCKLIKTGEKTVTWRINDDKNLTTGDQIEFIERETKESFGTGKIISLEIKTLGTLSEQDWVGHEKFASLEKMYETYRNYYGDSVGPNSEVKIIQFTFQPSQ